MILTWFSPSNNHPNPLDVHLCYSSEGNCQAPQRPKAKSPAHSVWLRDCAGTRSVQMVTQSRWQRQVSGVEQTQPTVHLSNNLSGIA